MIFGVCLEFFVDGAKIHKVTGNLCLKGKLININLLFFPTCSQKIRAADYLCRYSEQQHSCLCYIAKIHPPVRTNRNDESLYLQKLTCFHTSVHSRRAPNRLLLSTHLRENIFISDTEMSSWQIDIFQDLRVNCLYLLRESVCFKMP